MLHTATDHAIEPATAPAITPCVKLCWLDPATSLCQGCGRTLAEIAGWSSLDTVTRRAIMDQLPRRRAKAASTPRGAGP